MESRANFGKESVAEVHWRLKWVPHYGAQADAGGCSDSAQERPTSALVYTPWVQVKAAHVRRLKRSQRG